VTFLFTDIVGSTRLWEADGDAMSVALAAHDAVLAEVVVSRGGWVFKHTGDGVCAVFGSARAAVDAAVEAQRRVGLPVRMGVGTGEAELRGEDYFGPALNRAARVMAAGHGGQVLVAASTAAVVDGVELVDLGEHSLRDLSGVHRLFQVRAEGLRVEFPPLRTLDVTPGNLPVQTSSFVGRMAEVAELVGVVRNSRLVTLTGVGGVGKTRLAMQVAGELVPEFDEGVWLVELAAVGDPAAVPDVVATALGVVPQPAMTVTDSIATALAGRRVLVVLDNCEHVLDAAAGLVEAVLARSASAKVLATSREGLRVGAECLWPVPSLASRDGDGAAVALFVERARAVVPRFALDDPATAATAATVVEICERLDGIPLAIELAAARMVSMNPTEVLERLSDRFRLLAGARRSPGRHQTLRHAVAWSYDLLTVEERDVLARCAVFAAGFDAAAATELCDVNEYELLDALDSLVRKSLMTTTQVGGHTRYGLYETIRLFAEEQIDPVSLAEVRDRHARYFAEQIEAWWTTWDSPDQRLALEWVDVEFANLRAGFYWAADHGDIVTATKIAAHTAVFAQSLSRYEPVGWAEELLAAATVADVPQLPRLYAAAAFCSQIGRPDSGREYARRAAELERDPKYDPFNPRWAGIMEALAHIMAGDLEMTVGTCRELASRTGLERVIGLAIQTFILPALGRGEEARALADGAVSAAREHGNPFWIAMALDAYGRAYAQTDADKALGAFRESLEIADRNHIAFFRAGVAADFARLVAEGDLDEGLALFDEIVDAAHRGGSPTQVDLALADLAFVFRDLGRAEIAATVYGSSTRSSNIAGVTLLPELIEHLRDRLGEATFDECVATGAAMETADAVRFARQQIQTARDERETT
jgi:predicted ATPase